MDVTHAQVRYAEVLRKELLSSDRWLDLGCGHQIVPAWALSHEKQRHLASAPRLAVGADADSSIASHVSLRHRVMATGSALPFRDNAFTLVTANMVMEHVESPAELLGEVARVIEPGGRFVFHTPNVANPIVRLASAVPSGLKRRMVWWLEGRHDEDVFDTYYRLNTVGQVRRAAEEAGFVVRLVEPWSSVGVFSSVPVLRALERPWLWLLEQERFKAWGVDLCVHLVKPLPAPGEEARVR